MGRKRNQGKARRAAKAKAREEAGEREENNNQAITDGQGQSLSAQLRRQFLHLQASEKCLHGFDPNDSTYDFCFQFVKAFNSSFGGFVRYGVPPLEVLLHAKNATMDHFAYVWEDSTKMEMVISLLLYAGATSVIEGDYIVARE